jgi:hypothetical protein
VVLRSDSLNHQKVLKLRTTVNLETICPEETGYSRVVADLTQRNGGNRMKRFYVRTNIRIDIDLFVCFMYGLIYA